MVNYEEKIKALKEKGIFSQEQVQRVMSSFDKQESKKELDKKRTYILEIVGAIIFGAVLFYMIVMVGSSNDTNSIEDISHTLNAPISASASIQGSFGLIWILVLVVLYVVLYVFSHYFFGKFWHMAREYRVLQDTIYTMQVMKKELLQTAQNLIKDEKEPQGVLISSSIRADVLELIKQIEFDINQKEERLKDIEHRCKIKQHIFPNNLSKLVGKLPLCYSSVE